MNQRKRKHANVPCISLTLNAEMLFELFKLKFFQGSLSHCVHVRQTHLTMSNRMQFCVCVSTIAKHERFRLRSKRNEHPFAQSDAVGSAEIDCVFFSFGSFSLLGCSRFTSSRALPSGNTLHSTLTIRFASQIKRKK